MKSDVLSVFNEVTISMNTIISENDQEHVTVIENQYNEALMFINRSQEFLNENKVNNDFYNSNSLQEQLKTTASNIKDKFIRDVVSYFETTYELWLDKSEIVRDLENVEPVTKELIVANIHRQLEGKTFSELALEQFMKKLREEFRYAKGSVKGKMVTLTDFVYWDTWNDNHRLSWGETKVRRLFDAISYHETNHVGYTLMCLQTIYRELRDGEKEYAKLFTKYDCSYQNVFQGIRFYKNGRVDIEFKTHQFAKWFHETFFSSK